jgi:hypothetical protein
MRVAHYRAVLLTLDADDEDATAVLDATRTVVDSVASHLWCCTIALTRFLGALRPGGDVVHT